MSLVSLVLSFLMSNLIISVPFIYFATRGHERYGKYAQRWIWDEIWWSLAAFERCLLNLHDKSSGGKEKWPFKTGASLIEVAVNTMPQRARDNGNTVGLKKTIFQWPSHSAVNLRGMGSGSCQQRYRGLKSHGPHGATELEGFWIHLPVWLWAVQGLYLGSVWEKVKDPTILQPYGGLLVH